MMKHIREWLKKYEQKKGSIEWNALGLATLFIVMWGAHSIFSGCASTGPEKKQKAVSSIKEFHKELSKNLNQITETLAALNQITKTGEGDLYKPYKNFVKQLNRTTENSRNMSKHAERMATNARQQTTSLKQQTPDLPKPELQSKGEERR